MDNYTRQRIDKLNAKKDTEKEGMSRTLAAILAANMLLLAVILCTRSLQSQPA